MKETQGSSERLLYPVPEARQILGGIGHSLFYSLVKAGDIKLTKIGNRSFVRASELRRVAGEVANAGAA